MKITQIHRSLSVGALALILLAGCVDEIGQLPEPAPPEADLCGSRNLQYLVGQNAGVLTTLRLPQGTRVIPPDMAVTMDYQPDRLNIDLDAKSVITRVYCT